MIAVSEVLYFMLAITWMLKIKAEDNVSLSTVYGQLNLALFNLKAEVKLSKMVWACGKKLPRASHAPIDSGVNNCIWLQALTLEEILPREGELWYDCIKTKNIERYFNCFLCSFFKNTRGNIEEKSRQRKKHLLRCLCLYSQELKP